jgi:hypothetical protein
MERHKKSEKMSRAIKSKGKGAGSGNFVPFHGISNPRVLSDMGLAIPRPTRLGDPRSVTRGSHSNIILTSLLLLITLQPLSWPMAATPPPS